MIFALFRLFIFFNWQWQNIAVILKEKNHD